MKTNWDTLKQFVRSKKLASASWKSDQASLMEIFAWAEGKAILPCDIEDFSISKFRTIIKETKNAIANNDPQRVADLFRLAAKLSIVDLRLEIGKTKPEEIRVVPVEIGGKSILQINLRIDQLTRIQASTKSFYKFVR